MNSGSVLYAAITLKKSTLLAKNFSKKLSKSHLFQMNFYQISSLLTGKDTKSYFDKNH